MSTLKCLACGHENNPSEKLCEACGSSLDLRFCPGCEAVNGRGATHCHSCTAALPADAPEEIVAPEGTEAPEPAAAQSPFRPPLRWRVIEADHSPARKAVVVAGRGLLALSLVALGALSYHFYGEWSPAAKAAAAAATTAGPSAAPRAEPPVPAPVPVAAVPAEPIKPKVAPAAASAPKRAAPEPKQATRASASVTHLRGGAPAPAVAAPEPKEKTVVPARAVTPSPAAAPSYARVTHTRAEPAAPVAESAPAVPAAIAASAPAAPSKPAASACPEAIAALGLCSAIVKREGN